MKEHVEPQAEGTVAEKTEGSQLISVEHLWKPFWKRVSSLVKDNDGAQHRFVMRNDRRSPHSRITWGHFNHDVDRVIGNDVHCHSNVNELKIVVIDRPLLLMIITTKGVEVIFLLTDTVEIDVRLSEVDVKDFILSQNNRIGRNSCELVEMHFDVYDGIVNCRLEGSPDMSVKIIEVQSSVTSIKVLEVKSIRSSVIVPVIIRIVSVIIRVVLSIILRFSLSHENTVTVRER